MSHMKKRGDIIRSGEDKLYGVAQKNLMAGDEILYAGHLLMRAARLRPDNIIFIYKNESFTYNDVYHESCAFGAYLQRNGIRPGSSVIIWYGNCPDFYLYYYGAWQIGAVVVPVNVFLTAAEFLSIVKDCAPTCIIIAPECLEKLSPEEKAGLGFLVTADDRESAFAEKVMPNFYGRDPHELSVLLYTSGTTGRPKGVMLSSDNIMTNLVQATMRINLTGTARVLGVLPLFHSFAQLAYVWGAIFLCCTIILIPKIARAALIEGFKQKPTHVIGVPAFYGLLCLLRTINIDSVRYFISGGDALPDKIALTFELLYRRRICAGYGLTECSPFVAADFTDTLYQSDYVGYLGYGMELSIRSPQGEELPYGEQGILWLHGKNVMLGYYKAPAATAAVLKNGWLNTGDLAYTDFDGRLFITGREKDLIINKGIKIYPQEIENIIMQHPAVIRVAVVGKKQNDSGEVPVAFVQVRALSENIAKELEDLCKKRCASYKVPREFTCMVEDLPLTSTSKIDKKVLRVKVNGR